MCAILVAWRQGTGAARRAAVLPIRFGPEPEVPLYNWLKFLHILSVFGFLVAHGVSVAVAFRLRKERDRARIQSLLEVSASTIVLLYVSLALLIGFGVWAAIYVKFWGQRWITYSIGILAFTIVAMIGMARPYYTRLRTKTGFRASGVPLVSDEELTEILRSPTPLIVAWIGFVALGAILYLMVFKPQ
jgi:uncharacterized membrane protein